MTLSPQFALTTTGNYAFIVQPQGGAAGGFRSMAEPTSWLPVAPTLPVDNAFGIIDLIADRNGAPLLGYVRDIVVGGVAPTACNCGV